MIGFIYVRSSVKAAGERKTPFHRQRPYQYSALGQHQSHCDTPICGTHEQGPCHVLHGTEALEADQNASWAAAKHREDKREAAAMQ